MQKRLTEETMPQIKSKNSEKKAVEQVEIKSLNLKALPHELQERIFIDFLDEKSQAAFARTSKFNLENLKEKYREKVKQLLVRDIQLTRVLCSFTENELQGFLDYTYKEDDFQKAESILNNLEKQKINNYQLIFIHFEKLYKLGLRTLNEDIIILLSGNDIAINAWIKNNFDRLKLPLDHNLGLTAIHYLAYTDNLDTLRKIRDRLPKSEDVTNFFGATPALLAAYGDSINTIRYYSDRAFFYIDQDCYGDTALVYAARGDSINILKNCFTPGVFTHVSSRDDVHDMNYHPTYEGDLLMEALAFNATRAADFLIYGKPNVRKRPATPKQLVSCAATGGQKAFDFCMYEFQINHFANPSEFLSSCSVLRFATTRGIDFALHLSKTYNLRFDMTAKNIITYVACLNDIDILNYFMEYNKTKPGFVELNNAVKIYASGICTLLSCYGDYRMNPDADLTLRVLNNGTLGALLICELLQPKKLQNIARIEHETKTRQVYTSYPANRVYYDFASIDKPYQTCKYYNQAWNNAWNKSAGQNHVDRICQVVDAKVEPPTFLEGFLKKEWDSSAHKKYLEFTSQLKKLIIPYKDKNPVELFILLSYFTMTFVTMKNRNQIKRLPLFVCARFLIDKTQEHILELRSEFISKPDCKIKA